MNESKKSERESQKCSNCGATVAPGSPENLCPACLLANVIGGQTEAEDKAETLRVGESAKAIASEIVGERIGRYKLLQKIGEGGCGIVYMAEQEEPVRRRVALKVIKLGMDTKSVIARFEAERQALAMMDHQNIARVLDAGATDKGRPFFVMELVKGIRITDYCDQNKLSTCERLGLFKQVCHAIQHAHQKGIIHRDIKPSNILVTLHDGVPVPKVIDFGIAKATDQQLTDKTVFTAFGQFIGTPAYMSPEQAELTGLDIDTRTDIYSLGVLLYELLTGSTPFDTSELLQRGLDEIRRTIREVEPPRPSTKLSTLTEAHLTAVAKARSTESLKLSKQLCGDLDWIVMKSLEKDRTRRYETANSLALDIQRHVQNEPVVAAPPSSLYRFRRFARKHRVALGTTCAFLLVLLGGIAMSVWQAWRANHFARTSESQRQIATNETAKATELLRESERQLYDRNIAAAWQYWQDGDVQHARKFLADCAPELRHWEWNYLNRLSHADQLTLRGHSNTADQVVYSPDGRFLASASKDGDIILWNANSGKELRRFKGHPDGVNSLAFSPDSRRLANGSYLSDSYQISRNGEVKIWEVATGQLVAGFGKESAEETCVAFSPQGGQLATGGHAGKVTLWDCTTTQQLFAVKIHSHPVSAIVFSPDGSRVASGSLAWGKKGEVKMMDASSGRLLFELTNLAGVYGLAFSPNGKWLAAALNESVNSESFQLNRKGTITVWDVMSGQEVVSLHPPVGGVSSVAFSHDGKWLGAACGKYADFVIPKDVTISIHIPVPGAVAVWETGFWNRSAILLGHDDDVTGLAFHPEGNHLASSSADGTVKMWELGAARSFETLPGPGDFSAQIRSNRVSYSDDLTRIAACDAAGLVKVFDLQKGNLLYEFQSPTNGSCSVSFAADGERLALFDGLHLTVYDRSRHAAISHFAAKGRAITRAVFSPNGRYVGMELGGPAFQMIEAATGKDIIPAEYGVTSFVFAPAGDRLITGTHEGNTEVRSAQNGKRLAILTESKTDSELSTFVCGVSPVGNLLALGRRRLQPTVTAPGTLEIWNYDTGRMLCSLGDFAAGLAAFSPDGKRVGVITGRLTDGTLSVKLWDVATGQQVLTLGWFATGSGKFTGLDLRRLNGGGEEIFSFGPMDYDGPDYPLVSFDGNGERLLLALMPGPVIAFNTPRPGYKTHMR